MDDIILTIDIIASSLLAHAARVTAGGAVIRRVAGGEARSYSCQKVTLDWTTVRDIS
jgi:hypothetical protein